MKTFNMTIGSEGGTSVLEQIINGAIFFAKGLNIEPPKPDPKDGNAVRKVIEKLSPREKRNAGRSRDAANQNPAR